VSNSGHRTIVNRKPVSAAVLAKSDQVYWVQASEKNWKATGKSAAEITANFLERVKAPNQTAKMDGGRYP
jgi:hypothetical protein